MKTKLAGLLFIFVLLPLLMIGQNSVTIVSWNSDDMFCDKDVKNREELGPLSTDLNPDILLLQEVKSPQVVNAIKTAMGLELFSHSATNFNNKGQNSLFSCKRDRTSFDIGIISRYSISEHYEFTFKADNPSGIPEKIITTDSLISNSEEFINPTKGYLWVRIAVIKVIFFAVHLTHSFGDKNCNDRRRSAYQREVIASSVMREIDRNKISFPGYRIVVAGDFNIGVNDEKMNGSVIEIDDCSDCEKTDCVDETHAILHGNIFKTTKMTNLAEDLNQPTQRDPKYWYMGPIDNIYVLEETRDSFTPARRVKTRYGSDHWPVYANMMY